MCNTAGRRLAHLCVLPNKHNPEILMNQCAWVCTKGKRGESKKGCIAVGHEHLVVETVVNWPGKCMCWFKMVWVCVSRWAWHYHCTGAGDMAASAEAAIYRPSYPMSAWLELFITACLLAHGR